MKLTIAVPTVPGRESLLSRCLWSITQQDCSDVEVLVVEGAGQLGDKANLAARVAQGAYLTIVDDDDFLASDYLASVLPYCDGVTDYIGFKVLQLENGAYNGFAASTGNVTEWYANPRGPVPKGVTRTELWRRVPMRNDYRADRDWMVEMAGQVLSWTLIPKHLYVYDCWQRHSAFGESRHRNVGEWPYDDKKVTVVEVPA